MATLQTSPSKGKTFGRRYKASFKEPKQQAAAAALTLGMEGKQKLPDSAEILLVGNSPHRFWKQNQGSFTGMLRRH